MKKIFVFVSLLVLALACAAPPTNDVATNRNTNESAATTAPAMTESAAIAQEKAVWESIKNKDYDGFARILATDQVEIGTEGFLDRAGTIASVKAFEPTEMNFSDWKFLLIDRDAMVLTYTVAVKGKDRGKDLPPGSNWRASSAWVVRDGKWQAIFHQSSPVVPMPSTSSTAAKPPAKSAASPASSPATVTTGSDPIANEKAIWEALKAKNWDGFAGALAADSIEVEPAGVFDKAGSVKMVQDFDFSKAELTDFRAVSFDADAALVIYKVKIPGPDPAEYHSTIWARREGKWQAVFHQGTPAQPAPAASISPSVKPSPATKPSPASK
jgi:hypothetical protein